MTEDHPVQGQGVGGPFVTIATFCERVLEEKDNVQSIIRIVDRYTLEPPPKPVPLPPDLKVGFESVLVVVVKSGDFVGPAHITIKIRRPSGTYSDKVVDVPVNFTGGEQGISLNVQMGFSAEESGLYWADVAVEGRLLTRVPLRVEVRSSPAPVPASSPTPHDVR